MLTRVAILTLAILGPISAATADEAPLHQIQFRGGPGGQCPDGYDFNYSNGRCFPNDYRAPGAYARPTYRRYGACPDGYDFNYDNGRCYPNQRHGPGMYRY